MLYYVLIVAMLTLSQKANVPSVVHPIKKVQKAKLKRVLIKPLMI